PMPDTTICTGDTIQLRVQSDALLYSWTPAGQVLDPTAKNPYVVTGSPTDYEVRATIGGCFASETIRVNTVPYPVSNAGADQSICYNATTILQGSTDGTSWHWEPAQYMSNPTS